jgi:hypothetical protein
MSRKKSREKNLNSYYMLLCQRSSHRQKGRHKITAIAKGKVYYILGSEAEIKTGIIYIFSGLDYKQHVV